MSSPATEQLVEVAMPQMGTSITEGEVIGWLKQRGDRVEADEPLCEISTDKVDSECPAPVSGVLAEILAEVGTVVAVGEPIARIRPDGGEAAPAESAPAAAGAPAPAEAPAAAEPPAGPRRFYSPVAKRIAAEHGVDLDRVEGSGLAGRVTRKDVERFIASGAAEPRLHSDSPYQPEPPPPEAAAAGGPGEADLGGVPQPLSRMRRSIGAAMRRSLDTAATCHTVVECDFSGLEQRRRQLGLTALPLVARATIETLASFPDLNATLDDSTITRFDRVHLGIAVSLGDEGLIVPVIRDAQELSPQGLAARVKDLAGRARAKQLEPDEVQGATFTITNPGAYGATIATPVISLPQVAILDLEAIVRRPVAIAAADGAESIAIRSIVNLVLGWDHRAIDGVYAARFLAALREALEAIVPVPA